MGWLDKRLPCLSLLQIYNAHGRHLRQIAGSMGSCLKDGRCGQVKRQAQNKHEARRDRCKSIFAIKMLQNARFRINFQNVVATHRIPPRKWRPPLPTPNISSVYRPRWNDAKNVSTIACASCYLHGCRKIQFCGVDMLSYFPRSSKQIL